MSLNDLISHLIVQRDKLEEEIKLLKDCLIKYKDLLTPALEAPDRSAYLTGFTEEPSLSIPVKPFKGSIWINGEQVQTKKISPTQLVKNFIYVHGTAKFTVRDIVDFNPEIAGANINLSADLSNVLSAMVKAGKVRIMKRKRILENPIRKVNVYQKVKGT